MEQVTELAVFDLETTGVDVRKDRIVTAFIGIVKKIDGQLIVTEEWSFLLNPGIEIPEGASNIHGITTAIAKERGTDYREGVLDICEVLDFIDQRGIPLVVMNARYDFSLLRHQVREFFGLEDAEQIDPKPVIDPYIIDKSIDQYRSGKRQLVFLARHYGVPVSSNAHDAREDCLMAGGVAFKLLEHPRVMLIDTLAELHGLQIREAERQGIHLARYFRDQGSKAGTQEKRAEFIAKAAGVETPWPYIPFNE